MFVLSFNKSLDMYKMYIKKCSQACREHENMLYMSNCPLYTEVHIICTIHLNRENENALKRE